MGIEDGLIVLDGDGSGDGLDHAQDGVAAFRLGLGDLRAARHVGTDLVDELGVAIDLAGFLDQHLSGLEGDGLDGAVLEVDDAGREEEEEEDQRHQHVKVKAAALVGPPEVAVEKVTHSSVPLPYCTPPPPPVSHWSKSCFYWTCRRCARKNLPFKRLTAKIFHPLELLEDKNGKTPGGCPRFFCLFPY